MATPTPKPAVERLAYSVDEVAKAVKLSPVTIHRAISHNLLAATKLGRALRIRSQEVERVLTEGLPAIPRYQRKTEGPTTRGRPRKAKPASKRKAVP